MSIPGYQKLVQVKTTGSTTWLSLPGNSATMTLQGDMLDDTDFTSTGWRSRVRGLKEYGFTCPSWYSSTNAALSAVRTALLNGSVLNAQYLPNGTAGFTGNVVVESFSLSGDVGGLESVDISLQSNGSAGLTTV